VGVESILFENPRLPGIETDAKPRRRCRYCDFGAGWMGTDLMNIVIDIDRGLPRYAGIGRSRNPANVNIGE
jgi:hypothetical protein